MSQTTEDYIKQAVLDLLDKLKAAGRGWTTLEANEPWVQEAVQWAKDMGAEAETEASHILAAVEALATPSKAEPAPAPEAPAPAADASSGDWVPEAVPEFAPAVEPDADPAVTR
jgi:hypothetical protein